MTCDYCGDDQFPADLVNDKLMCITCKAKERRKAKARKQSILSTLAFHSFCKAFPPDWGKLPDEPKVAPLTKKDLAGFTEADWAAIKKCYE